MTMRARRHAQRQRPQSASSIDEIIEVRPRPSELDAGRRTANKASRSLQVHSHDSNRRVATETRHDDHAKESQSDVSNDDTVQEYKLTSKDYAKTHEFALSDDSQDEHLNDDGAGSAAAASPEISANMRSPFHPRPWMEFNQDMRSHWESMYASVTSHALGGSWERAEDYQREKDLEMHRYLEDYTIDRWVIPLPAAENAVAALQDRDRWRSFGIPIFGHKVHLDTSKNTWRGATCFAAATAHDGTFPAFSHPRHPTNASLSPPGTMPHASFTNAKSGTYQSFIARVQPSGTSTDPATAEGLTNEWSSNPAERGHPLYGFPPNPNSWTAPDTVKHPDEVNGQTGPPRAPAWPTPTSRGRSSKGKDPLLQPPISLKRDLTPPYAARARPAVEPRKSTARSNRKPARRMADAEEYPWSRRLDFKAENACASWDDGIYDVATLHAMQAVRAHNGPIIEDIDARLGEQQRLARIDRKKKLDELRGSSSAGAEGIPSTLAKQNGPKKKDGNTGGDSYHAGNFMYATAPDAKRAADLGYSNLDDLITAAEEGAVDPDVAFTIKITWNPGTKVMAADLRQAVFSVRDTVLTRRQLHAKPILTRRAAECIIDFCPDMLWRSMLLRVTSEAGLGNKDVRDRFCGNGCYCDKATITKRISAALGQKQIQPKAKGYTKDEWTWYDDNVRDFSRYIDFFGKRTSHRNMLKIQAAAKKHRLEPDAEF